MKPEIRQRTKSKVSRRPIPFMILTFLINSFERVNIGFAAKAAIHAWSKALSHEVASLGVTVNSIGPGFITTPQTDRNYSDADRAALRDYDAAREAARQARYRNRRMVLAS